MAKDFNNQFQKFGFISFIVLTLILQIENGINLNLKIHKIAS